MQDDDMGASDRFSRTIPKDKVGGAAQWELRPLAAGTRVGVSAPLSARPSTAERTQEGYEAGRAQGYADVMRSAQQARAADLQRLEALLAQLQGQLQARIDELSSATADSLLDLAVDIAAQVLRREVQTRRDAILPVVQEALAMVVGSHPSPTVHLAPRDFELVRESLAGDGQLQGCRFVADASVAPGGCRIETPHGEVDATVATRWRRVVQTLGVDVPAPPIDAADDSAAAPVDPGAGPAAR
jgi:flagellar assembly protein FliH